MSMITAMPSWAVAEFVEVEGDFPEFPENVVQEKSAERENPGLRQHSFTRSYESCHTWVCKHQGKLFSSPRFDKKEERIFTRQLSLSLSREKAPLRQVARLFFARPAEGHKPTLRFFFSLSRPISLGVKHHISLLGHKSCSPLFFPKEGKSSLCTTTHAEKAKSEGKENAPSQCTLKEYAFVPLVLDHIDQEERRKREKLLQETAIRSLKKKRSSVFSLAKHLFAHIQEKREGKPSLMPPRLGIFALYYLLTKIGVISDARTHSETRENIRLNDAETTLTHQKRLEELQKALKEEKSSKRWSVATQIFSWFTSFLGIITGLALIASGVGVVAGAMLLTAGLVAVSNQILQLTGAWRKIANALPGDDPQQKRAVILWMQIGITVLSLILSGAAVIFGGYAQVGQAMQASSMVMGGVILLGYGVTQIGAGISGYLHRTRLAEMRRHMTELAKLKHKRTDLYEKVDYSVTRIEQLFEDLVRALEFEVELFRADQSILRR